MYKLGDMNQQRLAQFHLSFGGKLKRTNRWITLSEIIPWEDFEKEYSLNFSKTRGAPSLSFRIALGSLIIKERLNLSDVETVEQIEENPYMQYFLGFEGFISECRRKLIKKQLNYLKRNASTIESMGNLTILSKKEYKQFLVIKEVYRQQSELYNENKRSIKDRIVNAAQPYIRPIVRGKAGKPIEFGAKISAALVNGFVYLDRFSFDSYNESTDLKLHMKKYKKRFGVLPSKILADQIYRTRYNRKFCKKLGIELSGKPLGRPPKNGFSKNEKMRWQNNEKERSLIEGKFGQLKRRFSLGRIMAKLANTTNTIAEIAFLVVNLEKILALGDFLYSFINMIVELIDNKKFRFSNSKLSLVIIQ